MGTERGTRKRLAIITAVVVTMLTAGGLLTAVGRPDSASQATTPNTDRSARPAVPPGSAGPIAEVSGVPVGFARDEDGAVAAAIAYATAPQRWLYFTDEEITVAIQEIATPVAAPRLAEEVVADVGMARERLGASPGRVWWFVRPLAWQVESFTQDEARVAVWTVTVLSAEEVAAPQSEWITVTVDIAWVDGDWRIDSVRDTPGPTPVNGQNDQPWDAAPFDDALAGFTRMDGEPAP
jgi:hypothetical protein